MLSEIKLIRTDTTLDLSQKAEKVCMTKVRPDFWADGGGFGGTGRGPGRKRPSSQMDSDHGGQGADVLPCGGRIQLIRTDTRGDLSHQAAGGQEGVRAINSNSPSGFP